MSARAELLEAISVAVACGRYNPADMTAAVDAVVVESRHLAADEIDRLIPDRQVLAPKRYVIAVLRYGAPAEPVTLTDADRQAALLDAIRHDPTGRWKSGRAVRAYRGLGIHPVSPGTAGGDLRRLAEAGHLTRHDAIGVTWYEPRKDVRP
ncbi:hypothetical protein [Streptomyces sp. NBC_01373]|uniref:hypothetical protein n=1 Tax=Streptomyces sp. NBC_01373 TaxID=2903843 RepID=UPI0022508E73|nr:hypothetical protein [Streptomyces sp. NBC_01373]MCX4703926.1 hypothetical protein [Streptomyces sp. NBC_01373]